MTQPIASNALLSCLGLRDQEFVFRVELDTGDVILAHCPTAALLLEIPDQTRIRYVRVTKTAFVVIHEQCAFLCYEIDRKTKTFFNVLARHQRAAMQKKGPEAERELAHIDRMIQSAGGWPATFTGMDHHNL
jgi:hypothetical protein